MALRRVAISDLLSPILVKEFRQGVRGNIFTGAFLLLHGLMVLTMCVSLVEPSSSQALTGVFWSLLSLSIGVLIPLSGMGAVSSESTLKALEPMLLTRLSPRGIVFGKWASLAVQNLILIVSIAPYLLLRYFLGGIQIADELWGILILAISSALITAITVGMSAFSLSAFFRWGACLPLLWTVGTLVGALFSTRWTSMGAGGAGSLSAPALGTGLTLLTMLVMIEAGAWQIAPAADRSSSLARAAMLASLPAFAYGFGATYTRVREPAAVWMGLLLLLVIVGSLCEPQSAIPSVYSRYFAKGRLRHLAGWLLAPGWASGVLYAIVAAVGAALAMRPVFRDLAKPEVMVAAVAQLLLPLVLMPHITFPKLRPVAWYLIIQIASCSASATALLGSSIESPALAHAAAWLMPLSPLMGLAMDQERPELTPRAVDTLSVIVAAGAILLPLIQAVRTLRGSVRLARRPREAPPDTRPDEADRDVTPVNAADERVANL